MKRLPRTSLPLVVGALVATALPAQAHDSLIGSEPADGSTVPSADELRLDFTGEISELGTQVAVSGGPGGTLVSGAPRVEGSTLVQPLTDLPDGDYEVVWRVTSEDGHPISGALGFSVGNGSATTSAAGADDAAVSSEFEVVPPDADPSATEAAEAAGGVPLWAAVASGLAALALLGLLARTWLRGRR